MAAALAAAKSKGREEAVSASRASSLQSPRHHCTSRILGFNHPQVQSLRNLGAGLFSLLPSSQRSETRWRDNLRDNAHCGPVSNSGFTTNTSVVSPRLLDGSAAVAVILQPSRGAHIVEICVVVFC